ncbi:Secreted RxLR effector peptide protein [Phytophthora palmivora]|uniref:RxLR effector protein n=1 Tax=Phytophthora palmivora TaxID=4796 RepID=A0A2P4YNF0_9STRA|nr:Secreted RxLR effector peptide protein [Phytophthora palmivora]
MRLLLLALLLTLVTCLSFCEADSPNKNTSPQRELYTKLAARKPTSSTVFDKEERSLRGGDDKVTSDEERAIGQKVTNLLSQSKAKYLQLENKMLSPTFKDLAKKRKTAAEAFEDFQRQMSRFGRWAVPSQPTRFDRLYKTWLLKNHPDLAI